MGQERIESVDGDEREPDFYLEPGVELVEAFERKDVWRTAGSSYIQARQRPVERSA